MRLQTQTKPSKRQNRPPAQLSRLTERARCATMAVQGGLLKSSRSAARSARAPCISACTAVCAPRTRRRKTWASCVVAQTAARLARWLEGARELPGGERGHANCEDTGGKLHHTYERRPRARRRRARRRGAGAGSRRARSLLRRSSQVLLCRGRCIECLLIKIGNNQEMAMPMPGARVRAAGAGATPCPRKSLARSSVYT